MEIEPSVFSDVSQDFSFIIPPNLQLPDEIIKSFKINTLKRSIETSGKCEIKENASNEKMLNVNRNLLKENERLKRINQELLIKNKTLKDSNLQIMNENEKLTKENEKILADLQILKNICQYNLMKRNENNF
ncbi:hypothetical protein TRFO_09391 [Tritrichomonas foetus]|uniref:Uncharacterized protein n=1 Tax=Tritrichomonas foetus TaxID=1144522 RepID=A0A1J4JDY7_9EUKA|nr:hypothetical protein TRFO_09391 [Tritrichomonas foetus]|eukprot:OHS97414.1 hypothetical protein TRFO_09391 [Tritrichomonas foetus]